MKLILHTLRAVSVDTYVHPWPLIQSATDFWHFLVDPLEANSLKIARLRFPSANLNEKKKKQEKTNQI